nr:protein FAR1-RELATED SEQUENCE 5-like [Ipomoea batatas]GMD63713.1 protein FAR1-RELATED SEQUENCE 5-like [Ipomoea batatas]GME20784.1 protein FAR1-RELATED SEQUENCE 5-like [Ipomoea batatas]
METTDTGREQSGQEEGECEMEISPDGTKQWIPTANPEETPYAGQQFQTVEQGIQFYQAYAKAVEKDSKATWKKQLRRQKRNQGRAQHAVV